MICRLIDPSLDVKHFLRINGRLIENFTIVFVVGRDRLNFQVAVLRRCRDEICYVSGTDVRMDNLR